MLRPLYSIKNVLCTKRSMFLVCYTTASLSFPSQDTSSNATQFVVQQINITGNEA